MQGNRVVALGCFDGVHIGHRALLNEARAEADRLGCTAAAMTFDTHPDTLLTGVPTALLNTAADRDLLLKACGMDEVLTLRFDRAMMATEWEVFAEEILLRRFRAAAVVCGYDFRFGARGEGTAEKLREFCACRGIGCTVVPEVRMDGETVSSTRIRALLREGGMAGAVRLLGHPHILSGTVVTGQKLGHTLGIPTANLPVPEGLTVPAFGVYAAKAVTGTGIFPAVVNLGVHPTVGALRAPVAEAWLQDFSGDLYGAPLRLEFFTRLREERTFPSLDALCAEIRRNAEQAKAFFAEKDREYR